MRIWDRLEQGLDVACSRPARAQQVEVSAPQVSTKLGRYYVIKQLEKSRYLRLSENDYFVWQQLDGRTTVKDIVVRYFVKYHTFAFERIGGLLTQLREGYFLEPGPFPVFKRLGSALSRGTFDAKLRWLRQLFFQREVAFSGMDPWLAVAYRRFAWVFYTKGALVAFALISLLGLACFPFVWSSGRYSLLQTDGSYGLGFLSLFVVLTLTIVIHELTHALTTRHFGRSVTRCGFLFYFGSPCFFANTTDIWMAPKRARILVSLAGPYVNLLLGSTCSCILFAFPDISWSNTLYKMALVNYLGGFFNLNPLLELDGYFVLMDWLEVPLLRKKSLSFIRHELRSTIAARKPLTPEQRIYSVFGVLSALWTGIAICLSIWYLKARASVVFTELLAGEDPLARVFSALLLVLFILPVTLSLLALAYLSISDAVRRLSRLDVWRSVERTGLITLVAATAMTLALWSADDAGAYAARLFTPLAWLLAFGFALNGYQHQQRSKFRGMLTYSGFLFLLLSASIVDAALARPLTGDATLVIALLENAAYLVLAVFAAEIFGGLRLGQISTPEKLLLGLSVPLMVGSLVVAHELAPGAPSWRAYLPMAVTAMSLCLFIPSLVSYARTRFVWSFVLTDVGILLLALSWIFPHPVLRLYAALLVGIGMVLYGRIHKGWYFTPVPSSHANIAHSEREMLTNGFSTMVAHILSDFREKYGTRHALGVIRDVNASDSLRGSALTVTETGLTAYRGDDNMADLGAKLGSALSLTIDAIERIAGSPYAKRLQEAAHDSLRWQERELVEQQVLRGATAPGAPHPLSMVSGEDRRQWVRTIPFFGALSDEAFDALMRELRLQRARPGTRFFSQGDEADTFYILSQGQVDVTVDDGFGGQRQVATLGAGDYFGEAALTPGKAPRNATVTAVTSAEILALDRRAFLAVASPGQARQLRDKLSATVELRDFLRSIPLFDEFPLTQLGYLATRMRLIRCRTGDQIVRQGEVGTAFYIVKAGSAAVEVADEAGLAERVSLLGPGEYFGEIALVMDIPRTATIRMLTDGQLLVLDKSDFDQMTGDSLYAQKNIELASSRRMTDLRQWAQE